MYPERARSHRRTDQARSLRTLRHMDHHRTQVPPNRRNNIPVWVIKSDVIVATVGAALPKWALPYLLRGSPTLPNPSTDDVRTLLTVAEVAERMRVSKMTIYRLVHTGELPAMRIGRSFRIPLSTVRTYLDQPVLARAAQA